MFTRNDLIKETIENFYDEEIERRNVEELVEKILGSVELQATTVDEKVIISENILAKLSQEERIKLCEKLLTEQVLEQRNKLAAWTIITGQASQIDTGYIAQHLISLITQISGQGMRGKGQDLVDGSEIKAANFLDSLDKKGAVAPRWNFTAVTVNIMENFLNYKNIYLVSMDLTKDNRMRFRAWVVDISQHEILKNRYIEWMEKLGYAKFNDGTRRASVNFQLFPPRNKSNDDFARHGNGRETGFEKLNIPLENTVGSKKIFHAEEIDNEIKVLKFN